jgi:hypothetical protein
MSARCKPVSPGQAKLKERARKEEAVWRKSLSHKDRAKLATQASPWGREGGTVIALKPRRSRAFHEREKLRRERQARFHAAQATYEAECGADHPIDEV